MSRLFGWDLPPGVTMSMIDPPEGPCDVCGKSADECICPECPECGSHGDPACYNELARNLSARNELERAGGRRGHGLIVSPEQAASRAKYEADLAAEIAAENAMWEGAYAGDSETTR